MNASKLGRIAFSVFSGLLCWLMYFFEPSSGAAESGGWDLAALVLGLLFIVIGTLTAFVPALTPELRSGEEVLFEGKPSMKPAFTLVAVGVLFFGWRVLLGADADSAAPSEAPIGIYPLIIGLFLVGFGNFRFWWSRATTYCATTQRVVRMHKLFGENVIEISRTHIAGVEREAGALQSISNRGNLIFRANGWRDESVGGSVFLNIVDPGGPGRNQVVEFTNMDAPGKALDAIADHYPVGEED